MSIPSSGSSTWRSASTTSSFDGMPTRLAQPDFLAAVTREEMDAVDEAHPVAAGAHDERVRAGRVAEEAHAAQEVAVGDAGGRHDHLLRRKVVDREDALDVLDPVLLGLFDLGAARRPQLRLQLAAETTQRRCCQHRLPGSADTDR